MPIRYVNATKVLPPDLLEQLVQLLGRGGIALWVPRVKPKFRLKRDAAILKMRQDGYPAWEIAANLFICERTVFRVIAAARDAQPAGSLPSPPAPGRPQRNPEDETMR